MDGQTDREPEEKEEQECGRERACERGWGK